MSALKPKAQFYLEWDQCIQGIAKQSSGVLKWLLLMGSVLTVAILRVLPYPSAAQDASYLTIKVGVVVVGTRRGRNWASLVGTDGWEGGGPGQYWWHSHVLISLLHLSPILPPLHILDLCLLNSRRRSKESQGCSGGLNKSSFTLRKPF